ncbi:S-adenosyl-L-methionine-dependent methyltransferase [Marasmius fiardii PR-910]|nr:S-adenosyl-L-methionine-dependent methyltransferase [Marasmius fiardii PR-910]
MSSTLTLTTLASIISNGVSSIDSTYKKANLSTPSLDEPFSPSPLDKNTQTALNATIQMVVAASLELIATIRAPDTTLLEVASGMNMSATLGAVNEALVADVLRDAGPQGMSIQDLSKEVGIEARPLARVLRFLATRHVFREIKPNVFANNRISSVLAKTQPLAEIRKNRRIEYEGSPTAALIGHYTDEVTKSSPFMSSYLLGGWKTAASPFNMAMNTTSNIYEWFEEPQNVVRGQRFNTLLTGAKGQWFSPSVFTEAIDWKSLPNDAVVVDVGAGLGHVTSVLHNAFPHLQFILQDQVSVINAANKFLQSEAPTVLSSGRVKFQVHDFFEAQPVKSAAVYFMRGILCNWTQSTSQKIMSRLREAADSDSKLIVFDRLMVYACSESLGSFSDRVVQAPTSLSDSESALVNLATGRSATNLDILLLNVFNGMQRTVEDFVELADASGWKLEAVRPNPGQAAFVFSAA